MHGSNSLPTIHHHTDTLPRDHSPDYHPKNTALTTHLQRLLHRQLKTLSGCLHCYMHTSLTITTCEGVVVQVGKIELFHHPHQTTGKLCTNFQRQVRISTSYTQTTTYGSRLSFRETPTRVSSSFTRSRSTCQRQISVTRHLT